MSSLRKPIAGGGGGPSSITIREVDGAPSIVATTLVVSNGTLTDSGGGVATLVSGGGGGANRYMIQFFSDQNVPGGAGLRYLKVGQGVPSSVVGFRLPAAAILRGITIYTDAVDAIRTFDIEAVKDPSGVPVVLGTALALPTGVDNASRRDLAGAIAISDEIGVRIVRTSGAGPSSFSSFTVVLEVEIA